MSILILQHEAHEHPGHIRDWANERGHTLSVHRAQDPLPSDDPNSVALLIVLGGTANVNDTPEPDWLAAEKNLIRAFISRQRPVLGICLGSQLLADALGASVRLMSSPEIGWCELQPQRLELAEQSLAHLPMPSEVMEWHSWMFELPEDATRLASTRLCQNQIFIASKRFVGLQFHPEWTRSIVQNVIANEYDSTTVETSAKTLLGGDFDQTRPFLWAVLDHLVQLGKEHDLE